jgi:hypothetical protein
MEGIMHVCLVDYTKILYALETKCLVNDWHICPQTAECLSCAPMNSMKTVVVIHAFVFV